MGAEHSSVPGVRGETEGREGEGLLIDLTVLSRSMIWLILCQLYMHSACCSRYYSRVHSSWEVRDRKSRCGGPG